MSAEVSFRVDQAESGQRADIVVANRVADLSRALVQTLFRDGNIQINESVTKPSYRVKADDRVYVHIVKPAAISAAPQAIPLTIVYQDCDLAVIDKPPGLVVHPSAGHRDGTLANALTALFPQTVAVGDETRPGIVHRLDKDTSGLIVVALTASAHTNLQSQIAQRTARRQYLAVVRGHVHPTMGTIDAPIGRDRQDRKRMAVHGLAARSARTSYTVIDDLLVHTYIEASLHTGRTHQIRVHFSATGHPILGDLVYGGETYPGLNRQFLHAHHLTLASPSSGKTLDFESPLPADLRIVLDTLRRQGQRTTDNEYDKI